MPNEKYSHDLQKMIGRNLTWWNYSHDLLALVMIDTEIWSKCLDGSSSPSILKWKNTPTRRLWRHSHISLLIRQVKTCNFWDSFAVILMSSLARDTQGFIRTQIQSKQFSALYHHYWFNWVCCISVKISNPQTLSCCINSQILKSETPQSRILNCDLTPQ